MKNALLIVALVAAVGAAAFFAGKLSGNGKTESDTAGVDLPSDLSPTVAKPPTVAPAATLAAKPTSAPGLTVNPDGATFESQRLGIRFFYADAPKDKTVPPAAVVEKDDRAYVYMTTYADPTQGQSIQVFAKTPGVPLEQAISGTFLKGISPKDCFVKVKNDTNPLTGRTIQKATIGYPVPTGTDEPYFTFGEKCGQYAETNGIQYFLYDPSVPGTYAFLRIGQGMGAAAYNADAKTQWFETVVFTH